MSFEMVVCCGEWEDDAVIRTTKALPSTTPYYTLSLRGTIYFKVLSVLQDTTKDYKVLLCTRKYYKVLLPTTEYYSALHNTTKYYSVLQSIAAPYYKLVLG